jgi:hypothetical protein
MVVVPPPNRMSKGSRNLSNALLLIFSVAILIGLLVLAIVGAGFGAVHRGDPVGRNRSKASSAALVLYCAQDQDFAEKVIAEFSRKTGKHSCLTSSWIDSDQSDWVSFIVKRVNSCCCRFKSAYLL